MQRKGQFMSVADPADAHGSHVSHGPPLSLRVRGGPRDGQLVKLTAAKCTIGSSQGCTLRLRGKDVRPVHCFIVRGKANTIVRRWSADTLINGESFDDRPLALGDRLRCGPVEFEIVDEAGESVGRQPAGEGDVACGPADPYATQMISGGADFRPSVTPGSRLESTLRDSTLDDGATIVGLKLGGKKSSGTATSGTATGRAKASVAALDEPTMTVAMSEVRALFAPEAKPATEANGGEEAASAKLSAKLSAELAEREREVANREVECAHQERTLGERDAELAGRQSELDACEAQLAEREQRIAQREQEAESRLAENAAEGEENRAEGDDIEESRQSLEEEREKVERAKRELDAEHAMHAAEHARWKEDHRQWKTQRQGAESQMEGLQAQVEHQLAEILSRRKHLDQDRDAWKTESDQHHRQLEERAAEVARQAEELETWRKDLDAEREKASALIAETSRYEQLCSELADVRGQLAQRDGEVAVAKEEIERLRSAGAGFEAAARSDAKNGESPDAGIAADRAALERQAEELIQLRSALDRERGEFDARVRAFDEAGEPHEVRGGGDENEAAADGGEGSNLSTWALLKDKIDFVDDEPPAPPRAKSPEASSFAPRQAEPVGDDPESIERYMASLLTRVGGRSTHSEPGAATAASSLPPSESHVEASQAAASDASDATPDARVRRAHRSTQSVTPEEVAAMRELANMNARVAITRHGARQLIPKILGKAVMSVAAFAGAAAVYLLKAQDDVRYLAAAGACAVVGAMFFARGMTTVSQLFASRRPPRSGEMEGDRS